MQPILRLKKVTKSFHQGSQRIEVLNQLELTLEAGEIVSILGQSGKWQINPSILARRS